jgi:MoaA/NifB/PqqE/SkfB family radical SAM enzyme
MPEEPTELNKDARALRMSLGRIARLLREYPHLQSKYERARETMGLFTHPTFYEVTSRCNLRCHGCYYFEGGFDPRREEVTSIEAWDVFFAAEARRGVTMGQYFGGEPALVQDVLRAAVKHIPLGNIGTNGTIRIDPEIQLRIHLSVWGDRKTDASLRGKPVFMQGVKNYAGDPRVVVAYTFNSMNLSEAREIAAICRDHELHMTFNMFTPTHSYQSKVNQGKTDDQPVFPDTDRTSWFFHRNPS